MVPHWVTVFAWISVLLAGACALWVAADLLLGHPQRMAIMNVVWPVSALYFGPIGLWAYYAIGRKSVKSPGPHGHRQHEQGHGGMAQQEEMQRPMSVQELEKRAGKPMWQIVAVGASHCGAGCALGDAGAESIILWTSWIVGGSVLWARYIGDYSFAYVLGILFQYFSIVPMRKLKPLPGLWAAIKADTLSITTFEIGMFGWMALSYFVFFSPPLTADTIAFWFMMQVAMITGFATSYPTNWWLLRRGVKEPM